MVTCKNWKMTTLASAFQTKLVSQMMIKTDQNKLQNFTCFNDAIQSFVQRYLRIKERWNEKTFFDHWSNENDCLKKHKDHFKISWNCSIRVWQSFKDEFWICDNHLFFKSYLWNMFNELWVWTCLLYTSPSPRDA